MTALSPALFGTALPSEIRLGNVDRSRSVGLPALEPLVGSVSARLQSLGVEPGAVVVYAGPQQAAAMVLFWAVTRCGGVFAAVDEAWPEFQLLQVARILTPRMVVTTAERRVAATTAFPTAEMLILEPDQALTDLEALAEWAGSGLHMDTVQVDPGAAAAYLFTSGTSGVPKAVIHSRAALAHSAQLTLDIFQWRAGERLVNLPDPHTMSGLRNAFLAAPLGGLEWIPIPARDRSDLFALLDGLAAAECQRLVIGPLLLRQLARLGDRAPASLFSSLKAIYCTGASLDAGSVETLHARWGVPVINYYGLTETGGLCLSQRLDDWRPGDRSLGRPAGCEVRLADGKGGDVPTGDDGELLVRSPQLMSGYLGDPGGGVRLEDGWIHTGDLARRRPDGAYELVGRASQFIKTVSTDRVYPEEIERVMEQHPSVEEAAVYGRPDPGGGERIVALVVTPLDPAAFADFSTELADFVVSQLGPSRRPSIVQRVGGLPRQSNGNLQRQKLADLTV